MTYSTEMKEIVEERYQLCILLKQLYKRYPNKLSIFAKPCHIKVLFGVFLSTLYTEIASLGEHYKNISFLNIHENKLVSGYNRHILIRIWNTETYETIATLRGHTDSVECLAIHENKLYSGSGDDAIRVWKIGEIESKTKKRKRE